MRSLNKIIFCNCVSVRKSQGSDNGDMYGEQNLIAWSMKLHKSNLAGISSAHFMNFSNDSERKLNKNQCGQTVRYWSIHRACLRFFLSWLVRGYCRLQKVTKGIAVDLINHYTNETTCTKLCLNNEACTGVSWRRNSGSDVGECRLKLFATGNNVEYWSRVNSDGNFHTVQI